ncbi:MAG: DapH/DapD/GlmU-related protein [Flavobacteriales bacterium]
MSNISSKAQIGTNVFFGDNVSIGDHVIIGDNVYVGSNTTIDHAKIGSGTRIEQNCILGYTHITGWVSRPGSAVGVKYDALEIGENCLIR